VAAAAEQELALGGRAADRRRILERRGTEPLREAERERAAIQARQNLPDGQRPPVARLQRARPGTEQPPAFESGCDREERELDRPAEERRAVAAPSDHRVAGRLLAGGPAGEERLPERRRPAREPRRRAALDQTREERQTPLARERQHGVEGRRRQLHQHDPRRLELRVGGERELGRSWRPEARAPVEHRRHGADHRHGDQQPTPDPVAAVMEGVEEGGVENQHGGQAHPERGLDQLPVHRLGQEKSEGGSVHAVAERSRRGDAAETPGQQPRQSRPRASARHGRWASSEAG
jgi:hypothetical protein